MHITIYVDNKPVYLCDELNAAMQEILHYPETIFIEELSAPAVNALLHEMGRETITAGVMLHHHFEELKKAFVKHFTIIEAAGGIVENENKELLFIYRLDKWDLPKGKIEKGEEQATAALREVEEETGAVNLTLHHKVGETYHTYNAWGKHFFKTTYWFYITCAGDQKLTPQMEENIAALQWVKREGLHVPFENTYPSIKDILNTFLVQENI